MGSWNETAVPADDAAMPRIARGHVELLPSGSFHAVVYEGVGPADPTTGRQQRPYGRIRGSIPPACGTRRFAE